MPENVDSVSVLAAPKDVEDLRQIGGYEDVYTFTYAELRAATKNFRPDKILGEGGFGIVYKGVIDETVRPGFKSTLVAVKQLNPEGFQGDREWLVIFLSCLFFLSRLYVITAILAVLNSS